LVITGAISATNVIRVYEIDGLIPAGNEIGRPMYDYDAFIRELKNATDPNSWGDLGGQGVVREIELGHRQLLVVSHQYSSHEKVSRFLEKLRGTNRPRPAGVLPIVPMESSFEPVIERELGEVSRKNTLSLLVCGQSVATMPNEGRHRCPPVEYVGEGLLLNLLICSIFPLVGNFLGR
jgi:hypothetical protein